MAEPGAILVRMRERDELVKWSEDRTKNDSPLFALLLRAIADDDDLFALSLEAQPDQLSGRMVLSAVHFMLLKNPGEKLAAYFPSIAANPLPPEGAVPHFRAFCLAHRDELAKIVGSNTLQTTSAERAVQLLLALNQVAKSIGAPFSLIEVGCSAGLLLAFDRYRYDFQNGAHLGPMDAEVVISSFELIGEAPIPAAFPSIVSRVGLDLNPVDVTDPEARRWILGCTAADRVKDFHALRKALNYRATIPFDVVAGNAMETLPKVLETIDGPVCIYHSRCLYQWPKVAQEAFSAMLKDLGRRRIIHRIGIERSGGQSDSNDVAGGGINEISHTIYRDGDSETRVLGRVTRKGRIEWTS